MKKYVYYNKEGVIISLSEIKIDVQSDGFITTTKNINPLEYNVKNGKLSKLPTALSESEILVSEEPSDSEIFINETDWKVTRHRDQKELGIETSLSDEDFIVLLNDRQEARDIISENKNKVI